MSAEVVTKKRGRPKKADLSKEQASDSSKSNPSKSSTTVRDFSTTEDVSQKAVHKKTMRRKQITVVNGEETEEAPPLKQPVKTSTTRPKTKSAILDQAKAFETLTTRIGDVEAASSGPLLQSSDTATEARAAFETNPSPSKLKVLHQKQYPNAIEKGCKSPNAIAQDSHMQSLTTSNKSSFLTDFLSGGDATPEISEDSRISDRSAFKSKAPSIDDIVTSIGVSDLSTLEGATLQGNNQRPVRQSTTSVTPPKSFNPLTVMRFPNSPDSTRASRSIDPATYTAGSFSTFKFTQPLAAPITMSKASSQTRANPSVIQAQSPSSPVSQQHEHEHQQQQRATLQTSSKPQPPATTAAPNISTSAQSSSPNSQPSHPAAVPTATPSGSSAQPPPTINPVNPQPPPPPPPPPGPRLPPHDSVMSKKRPTEMSPKELRVNPEFKALRRKWTGLIVGIPVLVVTSYVLWNRLELGAAEEEAALRWWPTYGGANQQHGTRERGVLPQSQSHSSPVDRELADDKDVG